MANKRAHSYFRNRKGFVAIPVSQQLTLSTLASNTVIAADLIASLTEDLFVISADLMVSLLNQTFSEGPIQVGLAHGDLSVAEIGENLNANVTGPDDIIQMERARRPVRKIGMFSGVAGDITLNDGKSLRTKVKFTIGDGNALAVWAVNRSGATLTTGTLVRFDGVIYGRWLR